MSSETFDAGCEAESKAPQLVEAESLKVMTLNIAHGRKDSVNQMLLVEETIRNNVQEIAGFLDRVGADVVALQEADASSGWSGGFNHVEYLLEHSHYSCFAHGTHANNALYAFGTAVLSATQFRETSSHDFQSSWPTTTKGFTVGKIAWNPGGALPEPVPVSVISVHLDFSRRSVRRSQVEELIGVLTEMPGPIILMGDFNSDWHEEESSLKQLVKQLDLLAFEPGSEGQGTYGDDGARLDWILVSRDLYFTSHQVLQEVVSDHSAVVAELQLVTDG